MQKQRNPLLQLILCTLLCLAFLELVVFRLPFVTQRFEMQVIPDDEIMYKNKVLFQYASFRENPAQILVFGTSRTFIGFNPESFDETLGLRAKTFNMAALRGAPPLVHRLWLEQYLRHYPKPKLALLEVTISALRPGNLQMEYNVLNLRTIANDNPVAFAKGIIHSPMAYFRKKQVLLQNLLYSFRYRGFFTLPQLITVIKTQPSSPFETRLTPSGQMPYEGVYVKQPGTPTSFMPNEFTPDDREVRYFLDYAKAQGIPVALYMMPIPEDSPVDNDFHCCYAQHLAAMSTLERDYHVPFIDLNARNPDVQWNHNLFYDASHLNSRGAQRISQSLAKAVLETYPQIVAEIRGNVPSPPSAPALKAGYVK